MFITALTSVQQLFPSWAKPIQSIHPHHISWRSILILYIHLRLGLPNGSLTPVSPPRPYTPPLYSPIHATCPALLILLESIIPQYRVKRTNYLTTLYTISSIPCFLFPPRSKYIPQHNVLNNHQFPFLPPCQRTRFTTVKTTGKIIVLCIFFLNILLATWKTKDCAPNYSKHFLTSTCT